MVTKRKIRKTEDPQGRVKVGKLKLDRETVKNLTGAERKEIKGGARPRNTHLYVCNTDECRR